MWSREPPPPPPLFWLELKGQYVVPNTYIVHYSMIDEPYCQTTWSLESPNEAEAVLIPTPKQHCF